MHGHNLTKCHRVSDRYDILHTSGCCIDCIQSAQLKPELSTHSRVFVCTCVLYRSSFSVLCLLAERVPGSPDLALSQAELRQPHLSPSHIISNSPLSSCKSCPSPYKSSPIVFQSQSKAGSLAMKLCFSHMIIWYLLLRKPHAAIPH